MVEDRKQRIVGVIVLLALVAIILPGLISFKGSRTVAPHHARHNTVIHHAVIHPLPTLPKDVLVFQQEPPGTPPPMLAKPVTTAVPVAELPVQSNVKAPVTHHHVLSVPHKQVQRSKKRVHTQQHKKHLKKRYTLQLASLASQHNAQHLLVRLKKNGFIAHEKIVKTKAGRRIRIIMGPEFKRESADYLMRRVRHVLHIQGRIVKTNV